MKSINVIVCGMLATGFVTLNAMATPILYSYQDGDDFAFSGWTSEALFGGAGTETPTYDTVDSRTAVLLDPNVGSTLQTDVIFTEALTGVGYQNMNSYGPNGTQIAGMRFDFYAGANGDGTGAPAGLGFYFQTTGNHVWYYDILTTIGGGWNTYSVPFAYNAGLYDSGGWYGYEDNTQITPLTSGDFTTDLGSVNRLGIWITYQDDNSTQVFGIDDFGLTVPEPETYLVLGMALLGMAVVFRKRITESLTEARAMMQM